MPPQHFPTLIPELFIPGFNLPAEPRKQRKNCWNLNGKWHQQIALDLAAGFIHVGVEFSPSPAFSLFFSKCFDALENGSGDKIKIMESRNCSGWKNPWEWPNPGIPSAAEATLEIPPGMGIPPLEELQEGILQEFPEELSYSRFSGLCTTSPRLLFPERRGQFPNGNFSSQIPLSLSDLHPKGAGCALGAPDLPNPRKSTPNPRKGRESGMNPGERHPGIHQSLGLCLPKEKINPGKSWLEPQ